MNGGFFCTLFGAYFGKIGDPVPSGTGGAAVSGGSLD